MALVRYALYNNCLRFVIIYKMFKNMKCGECRNVIATAGAYITVIKSFKYFMSLEI